MLHLSAQPQDLSAAPVQFELQLALVRGESWTQTPCNSLPQRNEEGVAPYIFELEKIHIKDIGVFIRRVGFAITFNAAQDDNDPNSGFLPLTMTKSQTNTDIQPEFNDHNPPLSSTYSSLYLNLESSCVSRGQCVHSQCRQ